MPVACVLLAVMVAGCARGAVAIHDVQGAQDNSSCAGRSVIVDRAVVTATAPHGYFVGTVPGREDGDPGTSEGLYVYTGAAPRVDRGDKLRLAGDVVEYHGHTQLTHPRVLERLGRGRVPEAVPVREPPESGWESLESMRVHLDGATVAQATDRYGETTIATGAQRPFRRPDGRSAGVIEIDPDALGLPDRQLNAGSRLDAEGPLVFRHGHFVLWPETLEPGPVPELPRDVPGASPGELTVATFNLERFFDDRADNGEPVLPARVYAARREKTAGWLERVLHCPDVVAVQEVESARVLDALARASGCGYRSLSLAAGPHPGLGYLVRDGLKAGGLDELGADRRFGSGGDLFDRAPLLLVVHPPDAAAIDLINVHLRSQLGIVKTWVQRKRLEQAEFLRGVVAARIADDPGRRLLVLGDFNAVPFSDGRVDVLARITGARPVNDAFPHPGDSKPLLHDLLDRLPAQERYTYVHRGEAEMLDHILVNRALSPAVSRVAAGRGNADAPEALADEPGTLLRASDHDPLVVYFVPGAGKRAAN